MKLKYYDIYNGVSEYLYLYCITVSVSKFVLYRGLNELMMSWTCPRFWLGINLS